jgi:hypothetical protein
MRAGEDGGWHLSI